MPSPRMSSDTTPSPLRQQPSAETTGPVQIPNAGGVRLVPSSSTRGLAFSRAHYPAAAFVRYRSSCSRPSVPTGWPLWRPSRSVVDEALDTRDQIASRRSGPCSVGSNRKPRARPGAGSWLSLLVQTESEVGVVEGGCAPTRARARCTCRSSRIRPTASTPATPAIAANEGSRRGRSQRRSVDGMEMRTFGELRGLLRPGVTDLL
jgi:hypothetical protein